MNRAEAKGARGAWAPPETLGEYRLVRLLGKGSMGQVYLAQDTLLERPVAIKLIAQRRPDEDARRRFFAEARAIARLSHPNVVAVHRVGEVDGRPYLVTELVRGRALSELPAPMPAAEVLTIALGIARGLAAAHRKGVLHRDVKPANVMLTDEGEVKLLDFGLAKIAGAEPTHEDAPEGPAHGEVTESGERSGEQSVDRKVVGTPLYMAPEALSGGPASRRSDIYAAGAVVYELCTGVAPRDTLPEDAAPEVWIAATGVEPLLARAPDVDPRLAAIVDRCLAIDPEVRFASADELGDALAAIAPEPVLLAVPEGNPYRGLAAFGAEDRALFFGRAAETRAVVDRLRADGLVVVAGDSGVGKSSLCRAGVVPLVGDGALADGRRSVSVALVPGRHPVAALCAALAGALALEEAALVEGARRDAEALARAVRGALGREIGLVVLADQLEELVTLAPVDEAALFAEALVRLPAVGAGVRVLATVRGDYFTRIAALPAFGEDIVRALYLLRPLTPEGVRAAITGPAARKGVGFEPTSLVDAIADAAGNAGGLPLLQFALAELWDARSEGAPITEATLRAIGGVEGALARHAEGVLFGLGAEARAAAKQVLSRLVTAEGTRARRTAAELRADEAPVRAAIEALVRGRLVVAGEGEGETSYEIAHEALLEQWATLRAWLDETREEAALSHEIEQAALLWDRRGRREDEAWAGDALVQAVHRVEKARLDLPAQARAFLDAGVRRQAAARRRRRWIFGGGASALAVIAVASAAAAVAFSEKEKQAIAQQEQIRLAAADMGELDLVLEPFDWDAESQKSSPAAVPAGLDFRLYSLSATDAHAPGRPYGPEDLRRNGRRVEGGAVWERVEARSGPAFLEVVGRGEGAGAGCGSSWVYLQRLPGYTDRVSRSVAMVRIAVPSCQATRAGMVSVPGGEFFRNVGAPERDHGPDDEVVSLPAFAVDRTEVTRAAFGMFGAMEPLTGQGAARTSYLGMDRAGGERLPIVGIDSLTAAAYCRYMGKELPTVDQWQKAMRGGLMVDGRQNPDPKRLVPWSKAAGKFPANIDNGDEDGYANLSPVGAFPEDRSPYGVVDMAGNVSEWSRETVGMEELKGFRFILGASWGTPPAFAGWRNKRPERFLDFGIGIRCVAER